MKQNATNVSVAFLRHDAKDTHQPSLAEQRLLIEGLARRENLKLHSELIFEGGSLDELLDSDAFRSLTGFVKGRRVRTVVVASGQGLVRDPLVQIIATACLRKHGVEVMVAATFSRAIIPQAPENIVQQTLLVGDMFDAVLAKLKRGRSSVGLRRRKSYSEMFPEAAALAKRLHINSQMEGVRRSLRELSAMLATQGHLNNAGKPYHPDEVRRMILSP